MGKFEIGWTLKRFKESAEADEERRRMDARKRMGLWRFILMTMFAEWVKAPVEGC